jgi:hypothetical protein
MAIQRSQAFVSSILDGIPVTRIRLWQRMEQSQKIGAGEPRRCHMGHFTHWLPSALNHESFPSVANAIEQFGKAARRFRR